jgi:hypothetical protein
MSNFPVEISRRQRVTVEKDVDVCIAVRELSPNEVLAALQEVLSNNLAEVQEGLRGLSSNQLHRLQDIVTTEKSRRYERRVSNG